MASYDDMMRASANEGPPRTPDAGDVVRLVEDLRLHQAELEMQNQQLREMQQELEGSRARYADLYDFAPVGYCTLDGNGHILEINLTGAALLGVERTKLVGRLFPIVVRDVDRRTFRDHLRRCADAEGKVISELAVTTLDGHALTLELVTLPASRQAGGDGVTRQGFHTALIDISERKRSEDALRFIADAGTELARSLDVQLTLDRAAQLMVEALADICVIQLGQDFGSLRRVAIAAVDPNLAEWWQLMESESGPHPLVSPTVRAALASGKVEHVANRSDVQGLHLRGCTAIPLGGFGRTLGVMTLLATGIDRERARPRGPWAEPLGRMVGVAVENARLYREATEAVGSRDNVLAVVSHDLRNLLAVVLVNIRLMQQHASEQAKGGAGEEDGQAQLAAVQRTVETMVRLIQDLLDTAGIDAGRLSVDRHLHPFRQVAEQALRAAQPQMTARSQRLVQDINTEALVLIDRDRIAQVISNLLSNAIKFTPPGGTITVRALTVGEEVHCAIGDTGPGIPPQDLQHIFERFWQARPSGQTSLGLGLSIARGLVAAHGGTLRAESRVGQGSEFTFTLPVAGPTT